MSRPNDAMTPKFRVSFPKVFKAEVNTLSGKEEFSLVAIFSKDADLAPLIAAWTAAKEATWGADPKKWPKGLRSPFRKNEEMFEKDENGDPVKDDAGNIVLKPGYEPGGVWIRLKSKQKPGLVDGKRNPILKEEDFYSGSFARATCSAFAYDMPANKGVSFWVQNIQKVGEGDPIGGGRPKAEAEFEAIEDLAEGTSSESIFS